MEVTPNSGYLGFMDAKAHARLEALFTKPPADMMARLKKACEHLGVTGAHAELFVEAIDYQNAIEQLEARVEAGTWPIGNPGVLREHLKRSREGDAEALRPVLAYVTNKAVEGELLSLDGEMKLWRFGARREIARPGTTPPPPRAA